MFQIAVEGNIGSGKTTVIRCLKKAVECSDRKPDGRFDALLNADVMLDDDSKETDAINRLNQSLSVKFIAEPVDKWRNLNGVCLLELMYKDSQRWAGTFHSYALLTMFQNHLKLNELCGEGTVDKSGDEMGATRDDQNVDPGLVLTSRPGPGVKVHEDTFSLNIMERSLYSANYCFIENMFRSQVFSLNSSK